MTVLAFIGCFLFGYISLCFAIMVYLVIFSAKRVKKENPELSKREEVWAKERITDKISDYMADGALNSPVIFYTLLPFALVYSFLKNKK